MNDSLNFTVQYYFPGRLIWGFVGAASILGGVASGYYIMVIAASAVSFFVLTTRYGVEIDIKNHTYKEYIWLFGLKHGETIHFENIKYFFIKDFKISETFNSRVNSATVTHVEYRGYIKFNEDEKVHIITKIEYDELVIMLKKLSTHFNVGLVDYSFGHQVKLL